MLKLLHRLLMGSKPLACRIYPPGVALPVADLQRKGRLIVVIDLE